jgi:hypothetical protein
LPSLGTGTHSEAERRDCMSRTLWVVTLLVLAVTSVGPVAWAQDTRQYVVVYVEFKPA